MSSIAIAALLLLSLSPSFCSAWSMADDCADSSARVSQGMMGALNMAIYAKMRAANDPARLGTSMVDLLGAPSEDDLDTLKFVQTWFQKAVDAASTPNGLIIHCSDAHLKLVNPVTAKFIDTERNNVPIYAPRPSGPAAASNACGGAVKAFTYSTGPQQIIVLCSDSDIGALRSSVGPTLDQWRTAGDLRAQDSVKKSGLDYLGTFLSTMILHELMHAAGFAEQKQGLQLSQFPATLPDTANGQPVSEIYQYSAISGKKIGDSISGGQSTINNLQHNADSFALLAASWYLPPYAWVNGVCKSMAKVKQAPAVYPNTPAPPPPS